MHDHYDVRCSSYPQDAVHTYGDLGALAADPLVRAGGGIVLAESFGGAVALMLALKRPELVRRIVLVNTFSYFPCRVYPAGTIPAACTVAINSHVAGFTESGNSGQFAVWKGERLKPDADFAKQVPPAVRIVSPKQGGSVESREVTLEIEAEDKGGGVQGP